MDKKDILLLLGGTWHDFEGFSCTMKSLLESAGFCVHVTYDFEILTHLNELDYDLLLSYTCLGAPEVENSNAPVKFSEAQISALVQWVECGGSFLAVHAATVIGDSSIALESLLGGAFISHPPQSIFQVIPLSAQHPITDGIEAFEVDDELYIERYHSTITIHMIAIYEGLAFPVVWSQDVGLGRVAHISLGHSCKTWELKSYQQLIMQTIRWMINY
jgi:hypothetical protein